MNHVSDEELLEKITGWVRELQGSTVEVNASTCVLSESLLDSMKILTLISQMEDEYGITINEEELIPENFETPQKIVTLLQKSLG